MAKKKVSTYKKVSRTTTHRTKELFAYITTGSKQFVKTQAKREKESMSAIVEKALKHYAGHIKQSKPSPSATTAS
jgi:hypothetical protein